MMIIIIIKSERHDNIIDRQDRPIMSVKYCLPAPVFYIWRKL